MTFNIPTRKRTINCEDCGAEFITPYKRQKRCSKCKDGLQSRLAKNDNARTSDKKKKKNREKDADFNNLWIMKAL